MSEMWIVILCVAYFLIGASFFGIHAGYSGPKFSLKTGEPSDNFSVLVGALWPLSLLVVIWTLVGRTVFRFAEYYRRGGLHLPRKAYAPVPDVQYADTGWVPSEPDEEKPFHTEEYTPVVAVNPLESTPILDD